MKFGVEIELDATDGRDFASRPLSYGEMPAGCDSLTRVVSGLGLEIQSHGWRHNHNNSVWICKPDSSCGIELCSPVLDESRIGEVEMVLDALASRSEFTAGPNCSFHVHVEVSDLIKGMPESSSPLCSVLAWWVKCEPLFMQSVPHARRNSRFCRCIGMTDLFGHEEKVVPCLAVNKLRDKYLSLNTHHLVARKRNSIEFRLLEGTKDSYLASSWISFLLNFVRRVATQTPPEDYTWVSADRFFHLIGSDHHAGWIKSRISSNFRSDSLRFWSAICESDPSLFGRMSAFIGEPGYT